MRYIQFILFIAQPCVCQFYLLSTLIARKQNWVFSYLFYVESTDIIEIYMNEP